VSKEKIDEIKSVLHEAQRLISSLEAIAKEFQQAMVLAENQEDREDLLKSRNLLDLEVATLKALSLAVERISKICIELHEHNLADHAGYDSVIKQLKPFVASLVTIADAFEAASKTAKYSSATMKVIKSFGIIIIAGVFPEILRKLGYL
jgi:hypothetical protein